VEERSTSNETPARVVDPKKSLTTFLSNTDMTTHITQHVIVPVANQKDARTTAQMLEPYEFERVTVLHVVEKGEGVPDKIPVEQSEEVAAKSFATFRETFPDAQTEITYRRDVIKGILEVADDIDASAIVFSPRGGTRFFKWLAGDRSLRLITEADRPVISIPERGDK
jgi:nucleotide-binding universal stress UspA family protein